MRVRTNLITMTITGRTSKSTMLSIAAVSCLLCHQRPASAQSLPGAFDEFNSWWKNPANGTLGVIPGAQICVDLDGNSSTESCYAQPTLPAGALTNLRLSPTRRILLAYGNTSTCGGSSMVHFFDIPNPPGTLTLIDSACIPNGINSGHIGFYDTGLCCDGLTDLACAGALGLDCFDGNGASLLGVSPQRIAYVADIGNASTQRVQIHWFDLVGGTHKKTFPGFNQALPLTPVQVSPYGDVALIHHDGGGSSDSDYTAVDLCGGNRLGTPLFSNVGGALFDLPLPIATAEIIDNGNDYLISVIHPNLSGGSLNATLTPCSESPPPTIGACCRLDGCSLETVDDCELLASSWLGPNTDCVDCPLGTLAVNVFGPGSVGSSPGGIACPSDCDESYALGVNVTLTASPSAGAQFLGWGGSCFGIDSVTQVDVDADKTCTATFDFVTDISIQKNDDIDPIIAGMPLTYRITVANNGPSDAGDVIVTDTLPAGVTYDAALSEVTCNPFGNTIICNLGGLNNGASTQVIIGVIVDPNTRGNITNRATVAADVSDSNLSNNAANESTTIDARADLSVVKSATPNPVSAGSRLVYEIVVTNAGPSTATGVDTIDTLPTWVTPIGDPSNPGQISCGAGDGDVDVGESVTFAFATRVAPSVADGTMLTNTIEVSASEIDPDPTNNVYLLDTIVSPPASSSAAIEFVKVADTATLIPNGMGSFTRLAGGDKAALSQGNVAFRGIGLNQDGIYRWSNGMLEVIADTNSFIPGGNGTFGAPATGGFNIPSIDGLDVAFGGDDLTISQRGVYTSVGGTLEVVADKSTRPPGAGDTFSTLGAPSLDGDSVSIWGFVPANPIFEGIYLASIGGLTLVANESTVIPGNGGRFTGFNPNTQQRHGNVAFFGRDSTFASGLYTCVAGTLQVVADKTTLIPGGGGFMNLFYNLMSYDGSNLAFVAHNSLMEDPRLYFNDCVGSAVAADTSTPIPCGSGNFTGFFDLSLQGGNLAFLGTGDGQLGIYADVEGRLIKVISQLDALDGKIVDSFRFGREGLYGNQVTFTVIFTDDSEGIYLANLSTSGICKPYDYDADGDRDLHDYAALKLCVAGDGVSYLPDCGIFDADGDGDIDGDDYAVFVAGMTGPRGTPHLEACCLPSGGGCAKLEPLTCEVAYNGTVMPGEFCANNPCSAGPGVCCSIKGCLEVNIAICDKLQGTFIPGQSCSSNPCGP